MGVYADRFAEFYDFFYGEKDYSREAAFVHECFRKYGEGQTRTLLELACGTGNHALALGRHGYKIVATDCSEDMLHGARQKADRSASTVDFKKQDMRSLDLGGQVFDGAYCLFDSIGYVVTDEALRKVFQGVRNHLRPNGLFIFEFWHAVPMLREFSPARIRRWNIPGGEIVRISETRLEEDKHLAEVTYTVYDLKNDGTYTSFRERHVNRYFHVPEMARLLSGGGFCPVKWLAGFFFQEDITGKTWHIVAVARKSVT